jgi:hypothetical protein
MLFLLGFYPQSLWRLSENYLKLLKRSENKNNFTDLVKYFLKNYVEEGLYEE